MSQETIFYLARHGKTMFNTIERVQGWCDTPLTKTGIEYVRYLGKGLKDIPFEAAYSSDSGRAIETATIVLNEHNDKNIPYSTDKRIREWCFGSLEGGYDGELWGVIPRFLEFKDKEEMFPKISYEELAEAILAVDTANWAEPYTQIKERIWNGFTDIAEKHKGGNVFIVSHGLTIANFLNIIDPDLPTQINLENASICKLSYKNGKFTILSSNDTSYIEAGKLI